MLGWLERINQLVAPGPDSAKLPGLADKPFSLFAPAGSPVKNTSDNGSHPPPTRPMTGLSSVRMGGRSERSSTSLAARCITRVSRRITDRASLISTSTIHTGSCSTHTVPDSQKWLKRVSTNLCYTPCFGRVHIGTRSLYEDQPGRPRSAPASMA
jgi:hypothetical protein